MTLYGYALTIGGVLQATACLMNAEPRHSLVQIGLGLGGVVLMIFGFHHLIARH